MSDTISGAIYFRALPRPSLPLVVRRQVTEADRFADRFGCHGRPKRRRLRLDWEHPNFEPLCERYRDAVKRRDEDAANEAREQLRGFLVPLSFRRERRAA